MEQKNVPLPSDLGTTFTQEVKLAAKALGRWTGPEKK